MASLLTQGKTQILLKTYKVLCDKNSHNLSVLIYNYLPLCSVHSRCTFLFAIPQAQHTGPYFRLYLFIPLLPSRVFKMSPCLSKDYPIINSSGPLALFLVFHGAYHLSLYNRHVYYVRVWFPWLEYKVYERGYFCLFYSPLYLMNEWVASQRMTKEKGVQDFLMLQDTHLLSAPVWYPPDTGIQLIE